uniref:Neural cell adhesion molecule L1.1-like n=1 Tax=Gadus morhua TaxID=8049 RepID=A0A8C5CJ83_GADMO
MRPSTLDQLSALLSFLFPFPFQFRWVKDGHQFGEELMGNGTLLGAGVKPEDINDYEGHYRCLASNMLGTAMTNTVELIVETRPVLPKQDKVSKKLRERESLVLECNPPKSSTPPLIHWMDKMMVHIQESGRVVVGLDGNMYYANVVLEDSREDFICNAYYSDARTILPQEKISLRVTPSNDGVSQRKPRLFNKSPHHHTAVLALRGHSLVLECIPSGWPTPSVSWRKKDSRLETTSAREDKFGRWLRFDSLGQEDDGEYECQANNTHGGTAHGFTVTVEAEPYWVETPESLLYTPGENLRLHCQVDGIPTPTITWSMNGVPIKDVDLDPRRSVSQGVFILRDAVLDDTAVLQCEASNKHGSILHNTFIYVVELPPQILSSDAVVYTTTEGKDINMQCETFGSPLPHVTWERDGGMSLLTDQRVSLLTDGTLMMSSVESEDSGRYTCSIQHTNISIDAYLTVLNRTMIVSGPQHLRPLRGTDALFNCVFQTDTQLSGPQVIWKKKGNKLTIEQGGDHMLVLPSAVSGYLANVQSDDSGEYSCEVITKMDHVHATGFITVVGPPKALSLSELENRSLTLSWIPGHAHNSPITEFIVESREGTPEEEAPWREMRRTSGDVSHLELLLQPHSTYRFRVLALNAIGPSPPSQPSPAHSAPPAVPDSNPGNVKSESIDPGTLIITWDEVDKRLHNGPDFRYKVFWREGRMGHWNHDEVVGPPFLVKDTETYTPFEIKVQAVNSLGGGPEPASAIGHSGEDVPEEAPGDVSVLVVNNTARVSWSAPGRVHGKLLRYQISLRRLGPVVARGRRELARGRRELAQDQPDGGEAARGDGEGEVTVVMVDGNKTSEEVTGLRFYSQYELSVSAFNSKGESPASTPHSFSTQEGAPGMPASMTFESPSETELIVHWTSPERPNGRLEGYVLHYRDEVENSPEKHYLGSLKPQSHYVFRLMARTAAGMGPPLTGKGHTLLDGVPPSNVSLDAGEQTVNLSWVPSDEHRNHGFTFLYKGAGWEQSELLNSTQGFYSLTGLQPGTRYRFLIESGGVTLWKDVIETKRLSEVSGGFATQGWFIGLISAVVLLLLLLLILCFVKRSKGGKYAVKDKEDGQGDSEARPMKDETFGEYSDAEEKRSASQPSLCVASKLGSDDSLAEYGDSVDIQFNEDGSFIGQYSGRHPPPHGNESSGPASPLDPAPPPPIAPAMSTVLNRPS